MQGRALSRLRGGCTMTSGMPSSSTLSAHRSSQRGTYTAARPLAASCRRYASSMGPSSTRVHVPHRRVHVPLVRELLSRLSAPSQSAAVFRAARMHGTFMAPCDLIAVGPIATWEQRRRCSLSGSQSECCPLGAAFRGMSSAGHLWPRCCAEHTNG